MKLYVLASLIVIALVVRHNTKRHEHLKNSDEQGFWERERQANSVRRQSLDNLNYITIPLGTLPTNIMQDKPEVAECVELLKTLSGQPIVNLTGYTNTDLKLEYGTSNITLLTEYDQNYTLLVRTLQLWADILCNAGFFSEARVIMEFAVSTGTDISRTYYKLAEIYSARGDNFQIQQLIERAQALRSSNKNIIVRTLQKAYP